MHAIRRALGLHRAPCQEDDCREARLKEADQRLHDQAVRLHVLEWEAYGGRDHKETKPDAAH